MHQHDPAVADAFASVVRGDASALMRLQSQSADAVLEAALDHGVLGFVAEAIADADRSGDATVPGPTATLLLAQARQRVVEDMFREAELKRTLAALDASGVRALVIKGGQLAYTHYPKPHLRPRIDEDLLIAPAARAVLDETLTALGYRRQGGIEGDLVMSQALYTRRVEGAPVTALDVHWRIANTAVFARVLEYEELAASAVPIAALGPAARGLSAAHAMLLACVHRVAHHADSERLIWLYDIHLLAQGMAASEWHAFADLAADREVVAVCRRSLERTHARFPIAVPDAVWNHPRWQTAARDELSAGYLEARRPIHGIVDDLRALPTWGERWQLAREHLVPSAGYMRSVFAPGSRAPLVWLHARRMWRGARKWLSR